MGEEVVNSFQGMEMEIDEREKKMVEEKKEGSSSVVRWESFLPRSGLRVLLVEADDSTRQIIGALLRKCHYKVATAPDGLKAWEVLKARPHNIDMILTEMELPAISGYALLTLIMEHEICKNIPVIMMSKYDSMNMVYKCMMRGAADFLVKPIRINELRNLWQHVWRRQSQFSIGGNHPQDDSVAQEKLEATAENEATSDRSSGSKAFLPRPDDNIKKGSDAQSSCGKLDVEAESAYTAEVENYSQPKQLSSPVTGLRVQDHHNSYGHSGHNLCNPESAAADTAAYNGYNKLDEDSRLEQLSHVENVQLSTQASGNRRDLANSAREAIDLIGAFDNHTKLNSCSNDGPHRNDSFPQLGLSLTRYLPDVPDNMVSNEKQMLNHSNASAFTRYVSKTLHASISNPNSNSTPRDFKVTSGDHSSGIAPESNSTVKDGLPSYDRKVISLPVSLTKEIGKENRTCTQKLFPAPLSGGGIRVDLHATQAAYGPTTPVACTPSPSPSPSSANQQMNSYQFSVDAVSSRQHYNSLDHSSKKSSNQAICLQDQKMAPTDDRAYYSSAADQSASSSLCNDSVGQMSGPEGGNEQGHVNNQLSRQRSIQREAALNKFRLKRKERCYEKKVRYESRKKLAEQRPRVKGQFVRQVPPDPPPPKSEHSAGDLVAN